MDIFRAVMFHGFQVVSFQHIQRDEFRRTLTGRRVLVDLITTIINKDRLLQFGCVIGEIFITEEAAILLRELRHLPGDVALIKSIASCFQRRMTPFAGVQFFCFDQFLQRASQFEITEDFTRPGRLSVRIVNLHT